MELKDTVKGMMSDDYKERMAAEYHQTKIRYEKLKKLNTRISRQKYIKPSDRVCQQGPPLMKPCLPPSSPKCENSTMKKCIFESSLKNTETQQG